MLGTPTCSDAALIDPIYAEVLSKEKLKERLRWSNSLDGIFSDCNAHNHVVEAYRDSGNQSLFPSNFENFFLGLSSKFNVLPMGVKKYLRPDYVYGIYNDRINGFKQTLIDTKELLDKERITTETYFGKVKDYSKLYGIIIKVEQVDPMTAGFKFSPEETVRCNCYQFTFNPFQLINHIIEDLRQPIDAIYFSKSSKIKKIVQIMAEAKRISESENYRLAKGSIDFLDCGGHTSIIQQDESSQVNKLYKEHAATEKKSDICIRFDEDNMFIDLTDSWLSEGTKGIFNSDDRFTCYSLSGREDVRRGIKIALASKNAVVINGVSYRRNYKLENKSNCPPSFVSNNSSFLEIANLLGQPILQPNGETINPEKWAVDEIDMVEKYRKGDRSPEVVEKLILTYGFDHSDGLPTHKKQLEALEWTLKQK